MTMSWKNRHSVTCLLCGGLADERRTVNIHPDELGGAVKHENPERYELILEIAETLGEGETHQECFDQVNENELDPSGVDLEP